jgi:hypothetical protein
MTLHLRPDELERLRTDATLDVLPAAARANKRRHLLTGVKIATVIGVISAAAFAFYRNYSTFDMLFQQIGSVFSHIADQDRKIEGLAKGQDETNKKVDFLSTRMQAITSEQQRLNQDLACHPIANSPARLGIPKTPDTLAPPATRPKSPRRLSPDRRFGPYEIWMPTQIR